MSTLSTTEVSVRTTDDGGSRRNATDQAARSDWWRANVTGGKRPADISPALVAYVRRLQRAWSRHDIFDRLHDRLYENRTLRSFTRALNALEQAGYGQTRLAVTTSIVDTFVSRFASRRTTPEFQVDDAEWTLKNQAQEFRKFLHGKMLETQTERLEDEAIKDSSVRGTGILYIDEGEDDIIVERVHRWELYIDPHEAKAGENGIRQMHRIRRVAREVLEAEYPMFKTQIRNAPASKSRPGEAGSEEWTSPAAFYDEGDVIDLYESWHLPSSKTAGDGRKAVCIEGCTLRYEEWTKPRFPFAILRRHLRQDGYWGQGDVERLAPIQHGINGLVRDIDQNLEVAGKLVVFTNEQMDATPTEKLTGTRPYRVRVRGPLGALQFAVPQAVNMSHVQVLNERIQMAYNLSGVSDWSAQAKSPVGAGASGIAIDTMEDLQSQRHATFEQRLAHWKCDVAQRMLDAGRAVAERRKANKEKYQATWMDRGIMQRLDWDKVAIREEHYQLSIEQTSFIPRTRAGRLAIIAELVKNRMIPEWAAAASFQEPDVAHINRIVLAKYHNAERIMEILGNPNVEAPVPLAMYDLTLHLAFAVAYYNYAEYAKASDQVLRRYMDYANMCAEKLGKDRDKLGEAVIPGAPGDMPPDPMAAAGGMPPGMPMPGGMPGMPPGMPMPPPGMMPGM